MNGCVNVIFYFISFCVCMCQPLLLHPGVFPDPAMEIRGPHLYPDTDSICRGNKGSVMGLVLLQRWNTWHDQVYGSHPRVQFKNRRRDGPTISTGARTHG